MIGLELLRELAKVAGLAAELLARRYARYAITTYLRVELSAFLVAERFKFCEDIFDGGSRYGWHVRSPFIQNFFATAERTVRLDAQP